MASSRDKNAPTATLREAPSEPKTTAPEEPGAEEPTAPAPAGSGTVEPGLLEALEQEGEGKEPRPWLGLEPLPPLDQILPEHMSYVRSVVARFSVTPTHWREDLVQEVMIQAHRSRESRLDVRALLFGITRHVVFRWMAKRDAERSAVALHPGRDAVTDRSVEDDWQEAERREAVRAAIDELPEIFRDVFVRTEIENMRMPEIAQELGIPLNTGYTRLHLARARFLESLQRILARRRIQKQDLSAPVVVSAASAFRAETFTDLPPDPPGRIGSSAGKAAAAKAGGVLGTASWIGGGALAAAAIVVVVWIARSPDGDAPATTATAEPRSATSATAPDEAASTSAHVPGPPTAPAPEPRVTAPAPIAPDATGAEDVAPPDASAPKESEEGLAARAVIGLIRAGRRDEALSLLEEFRQKYPDSLYWTQIRDALATPPSAPEDAGP
jgi:RNA polymerase sigma-70 factor, ECF subfamily